jgi:hypothetical protein
MAGLVLVGALAACTTLLVLGPGVAGASAFVPVPPYVPCALESAAILGTLEASLAPPAQASTMVGSTVTFSGLSSQPLYFGVASSESGLAGPDVDAGPGTVEGAVSGGAETWSFSSTRAAGSVGAIFWDAAFTDTGVPACLGQPPITYTTKPRELTVSAASPTEAPPAAAGAEAGCLVPSLKGDRARPARLALRAAGCRTGRVSRPAHPGGLPQVVVAQAPTAGQHLTVGSPVDFRLGRKQRGA